MPVYLTPVQIAALLGADAGWSLNAATPIASIHRNQTLDAAHTRLQAALNNSRS